MKKMVASMKTLDALKSIGLNLYERKIFVAFLARGVATAGELSQIANVPRSRSYDILESLAEKGFVVGQPSKPIRYVALAPKDALERTKENLKRKHEEMTERINSLKSSPIVTELEAIYKEGLNLVQPFEMTGTIKGRHSINQHLNSLFKKAANEIKIITTEGGLNELYSNHYNSLNRITKRGVKLRIVAPLSDTSPVKAFSEIADMKNIKKPLNRVYTVDDKHMVFALTDDKKVHQTQDVAFWAQSQHAIRSFVEPFFNTAWTG
ncbi:MAG: TrmB family transcriptional regulator [Candidatus Aenigmatarchaeota archaeon]|nr:MAG: TrmB family transcriptional regulator [Candidatus Aenigmarchaeota archaeon]